MSRDFDPEPIVSTAFGILHPLDEISNRYIYYYLRSAPFIEYVEREQTGVAYPAINDGKLYNGPIPLPPSPEQRRIVSKVDDLMSLCDELESRGTARVSLRERASRSCLDRLVKSISRRDLASAWQRLSDHFEVLYDTPETIAHLRQSILQLAVQGKLVPQDPNDEPADVPLKKITAEVERLTKEKNIRKPKPLSPIEPSELPFELPAGWKWIQAQDACKPSGLITYGILKPVWVDDGVPTIRVKDMKNGEIVTDSIAQCSTERAEKFSKTTLRGGDLLIAKDGATLGKTAFVPASLDGGNITQHVLRFPISRHLSQLFIRLVVDAPHGQAWMTGETKGVALPGVNVGDFRRMPIPLPPLAEQERIVAKVDQLLSQCDELAAQLQTQQSTSQELLSATIRRLLDGL